jgi:integrase
MTAPDNGAELNFHSLRHTARTWLEEAGQPKAVIDALIGHEGDTGKIYTTVGEEALRGAA